MSKLISDETLIHFGFKGMKWGFNKGKRNGKRVAEEGEMGPYTKDRQEVIDRHKTLKNLDDETNQMVGPLTFDSQGNPSFVMSTNKEGYKLYDTIEKRYNIESTYDRLKREQRKREDEKYNKAYEKFYKYFKNIDTRAIHDFLWTPIRGDSLDNWKKDNLKRLKTYKVTKESIKDPAFYDEMQNVLKNIKKSKKNSARK